MSRAVITATWDHVPHLTPETKAELLASIPLDEREARTKGIPHTGFAEAIIHQVSPLSLVDGTPERVEWLRATSTLHRFLDHGDSAPTACLWMAVTPSDDWIFYREYYVPNALISTHRQHITDLSQHEDYTFNQADPSIFHQTMQKYGGRWSVSDEYRSSREHPESTALYWTPADNNELGTRNRINEALRVDPDRVHPFTKERGAPRLLFLTRVDEHPHGCVHVIRQLRAQRRVQIGMDHNRPVFSDERDQIADHAYDCLRYGVASRAPEATVPPRPKQGTFEGARARIREHHDRMRRRRSGRGRLGA